MSYNIDSIDWIAKSDDFGIDPDTLEKLKSKFGENAPESSIFDRDWDVKKHGIWWNGEWSGHSFDDLLEILKSFNGYAELVVIWEGGDSMTGIRIRDHVVTKHEVIISLGDEEK